MYDIKSNKFDSNWPCAGADWTFFVQFSSFENYLCVANIWRRWFRGFSKTCLCVVSWIVRLSAAMLIERSSHLEPTSAIASHLPRYCQKVRCCAEFVDVRHLVSTDFNRAHHPHFHLRSHSFGGYLGSGQWVGGMVQFCDALLHLQSDAFEILPIEPPARNTQCLMPRNAR
jgi:hypothetical protein